MTDNAGNTTLTHEQSSALFDILSHHETYQEIQDFKIPGAIHSYGPPFQHTVQSPQSPILQTLLSKFALKLPGLRDVSPEFWTDRVAKLINELCEAELSESYDKGTLGIRKTLATAISALIEYPARGALGGFPKRDVDTLRQYDISNPDHVLEAWQDCLQALVYGNLIDDLFTKAAETDDLSQHDSLVQGMHEFIVVNLASIMHYTLILSPEGPTILRMIESIHNLIPYMVVRQALKVGNVATMLSGVMRIVLAKASVATVTNWIGLSSGADEGMNLLQQIITQVLNWDKRELKRRADKIEKDKDAPPKAVRSELKDWIQHSRDEHNECRRRSREEELSVVAVIMALSSQSVELSQAQHANALEYLSLHLGIRDREQIIKVLCKRNPDLLTTAIRDGVDAYTPMIRHVHQAVNLSDTLWDFERFLTDMLKTAKPNGPKGKETQPTVEKFVDLLHRHQQSCHKFLHQVAKNGTEVTMWWRDYVHMAVAQFRNNETPPTSAAVISDKMATGGIRNAMDTVFAELSPEDQNAVKAELDSHAKYVDDLHKASAKRISSVIKRDQSTPFGPGAYLARWQQLMDNTRITPASAHGPVRYGASKSVKEESRRGVDGRDVALDAPSRAPQGATNTLPVAPIPATILRLFGTKFKEILVSG